MTSAPRRPRPAADERPRTAPDDVSITGRRVPEPGSRRRDADDRDAAPLESFEQARNSDESLLRDHPDSVPVDESGVTPDRELATDEA